MPKVFGDRRYRLSEAMRTAGSPQDNVIATRLHGDDVCHVNENYFPPRCYSDSALHRFVRVIRRAGLGAARRGVSDRTKRDCGRSVSALSPQG